MSGNKGKIWTLNLCERGDGNCGSGGFFEIEKYRLKSAS